MKKILAILMMLLLLCTSAFAEDAEEITIDTSNVPEIPAGTLSAQVMSLPANQSYPVYSAPDKKSIRGADGRAKVSTNDWIQVFGSQGDWILVQYDIRNDHNRIGYINLSTQPEGMTIPALTLTNTAGVINYDVEVTDDPLLSQKPLAKLPENSKVTCLGTMGDWTYIESEENGVRFRGFVPSACLSDTVTSIREASQAMIGNWKLYVGSSIHASRISFREDGSMTGVSLLDNGIETAWDGRWSIDTYDANRGRYWNESEFELTMAYGNSVELYGLRICRQTTQDGQIRYALILSDGAKTSEMAFVD